MNYGTKVRIILEPSKYFVTLLQIQIRGRHEPERTNADSLLSLD